MPETSIILASAFVVVLLLLFGATLIRIHRRHSWRGTIPILLLRIVAICVLARLIWVAFFLFQNEKSEAQNKRPRRLVILRDESQSMDFRSLSSTRSELAERAVGVCRKVVDGRTDVDLTELLFGVNVVELGQQQELATDGTLIGPALARTLMRYHPDALVVVSDGAATDGAPASYLIKWLRNRNVPVFAVTACHLDDPNTDRYVESVHCISSNPEEIHARLGSRNAGQEMGVRLLIDGKEVRERTVVGGRSVDISFRVPRLDDGWHQFRVEIEAHADELTTRNNVGLGIFRVAASRKILFLYSSPKIEHRHLVRFLRKMYPQRIEALSVYDPQAAELDSGSFMMIIAGDLNPSSCPPPVRKLFTEAKAPIIVMSGRNLGKWTKDVYPRGLITRVKKHWNLYTEQHKPANVTVAPTNNHLDFRDVEFRPLSLFHFDEVVLAPGATPVYSVNWRNNVQPLMIADSLDRPRLMYLLSDTTWRWGLSPDARVRSAYRGFWRQTFRWVLGGPAGNFALDLAFEDDETGNNKAAFSIMHTNRLSTPKLTMPRIRLAKNELRTTLIGKEESAQWRGTWSPPAKRPQVFWAQAHAEYSGRPVQSERRPFLLQQRSREFVDALPRPELMKSLASAPENHLFASECEVLREKLQKTLAPRERQQFVRRRDRQHELILAAAFVLLMCSEWWYERRLKERTS